MQVSRKTFDQLVEAAIAGLPEDYARWLDQVPIIVEDRPSPADLQGIDNPEEGNPLGLYVGGSLEEDAPSGTLPPRVMLYRIPLMQACATRQQLADEIRKTLLHELGHHAGLDEDDLDRQGYGPLDDDDIDWDVDADE
jgi:predicted Zn-dependent protease with MMP-like domain